MSLLDLNKFKLQFITNDKDESTCIEIVKKVLFGGCKWIQLRYKTENINNDLTKIIEIAFKLKILCKQHDAVFIIDDYVDICKEIGADGVHLGKNDSPIMLAREILGNNVIIGGTANTLKDIINIYKQSADYIGLGPFRFTKTKSNLDTILGIDGYKEIKDNLNRLNIQVPIVAIGGIKIQDIKNIMKVGVDGIAISGEITNSVSPTHITKELLLQIDNYNNKYNLE